MKNKKGIILITVIVILIAIIVCFIFFGKGKIKTAEVDRYFDSEATNVDLSIIDAQKLIDEEIEGYSNDTSINLDNAKVMINPYRISPLTALIIFNTRNEVSVTAKINDETVSFPAAKEHIIPIYGLIAGDDNTVVITTSDNQTKTFSLTTNELPSNIRNMTVNLSDSKLNDDLYLVTSPMGEGSVAYDKEGNVRWYLTENYHISPFILENGNFLLSNGEARDEFYSSTGLLEISLLGKIYNSYILEEGYHHSVITKDDNYIIAANNPSHERFLDYIIEMNRSGEIIKSWNLYEIVKAIDNEFAETLNEAWAWNNSVYYDANTNSLILSLRGRNSIISIDYTTSNINWIFGDKEYWSNNFNQYILNVSSGSRMPLGQHSAFITSEGYLGIYNNGYESSDYTRSSKCTEVIDNYSSVELYNINNGNISQVMSYDDNKNLFSYALSNFRILNNNNRLILNGWEFTEESYTNNSNDCTTFNNALIFARLIELDSDNNIIFDATINQGKYAANKFTLYTNQTKEINLTQANVYNNIANSLTQVDLNERLELLNNAEPITMMYQVDTQKLIFSAVFPKEIQVKVLFVSESGFGYEYVLKEENASDLKPIYTDNLSGRYRIYLIWDENDYKDTEIILDF